MPLLSARATFLACIAIVLGVFVVYAHVVEFGFIVLDDPTHVTENSLILQGLKWESIQRAFTEPQASLWIPLTWISFMADISIFGLNPMAMHIENVLLHAANAVLLFLLLKRMTQRFWPSIAVAAFFAIHPINVESVAWVTERKNVLCLFFGLLSLHLYASYTERKSKLAYGAAIVLFAAALLAKPMLVPLPMGMLLLDFWPLRRVDWTNWWLRAAEKLPFLVLSIGSSVMTMQGPLSSGRSVTLDQLPLAPRISNALVSYGNYLLQIVWPHDLCVMYPHPQVVEFAKAGVAAFVLAAITVVAWRHRQKFPYLLGGWLWFLGMLVPMIGLVQVGTQARADRFTYTAQIGIFVALVWLIADLWGTRARRVIVYAASIVTAALTILALRQVEYWTNGATLFEHTVAVVDRNPHAYANAGLSRAQLGEYPTAVSHFKKSLGFARKNPKLWNQLALALLHLNRNTEAANAAREALAQDPKLTTARYNLAIACERIGDDTQAIAQYRELVRSNPAMIPAHYRLGVLLTNQGAVERAAESLKEAARLSPNDEKIAEALRKVTGTPAE